MPITSRFCRARQMISQALTRASCTWAEMTARSSASSAINLSWGEILAPPSLFGRYSIAKPLSPNLVTGRLCEALIANPLDGGTAGLQLILQPLKAAIEMIDAIDHGLSLGGKARNDQ